GAFLSGGIDSSIVVALMSELLDQPVKTFSIGFEEQEYNELPYARMIADQYKTEHHEFIVKPDVVDILPKLVQNYNEPYSDSSAIPTYYLAQMTRRHVTVALNGDGSDECFSGYPRHVSAEALFRLQRRIGTFGKGALEALVSLLPRGSHRRSLSRRIQRYVNAFYEKPQRLYIRWLCVFDNEMKEELYTPAFCDVNRQFDSVDLLERWYDRADGEAFIDTTLYTDVMSYLPEDLLVKVDIATMAHSLEARSPFVDHKVMEFAAKLPPELKLNGSDTKYLLKQTFSKYLPAEIRHRKKMGFGVPIDHWLRNELKSMAYDLLLDKTAIERGYFNKKAVQQLLDDHVA
ncbi:MAG: asparagine synthetase B, partial [Deltaproteobacteria bacterium]|nr:asparagine synthetase B [Deltaproteobacteria bacterium]